MRKKSVKSEDSEVLANAVQLLVNLRADRKAKEVAYNNWKRSALADDQYLANDVLNLLIARGLIPERPHYDCGNPECLVCNPPAAEDNDDGETSDSLLQMLASIGIPVQTMPREVTVFQEETVEGNAPPIYSFLIGINLVTVTPANPQQYRIHVIPLTPVV